MLNDAIFYCLAECCYAECRYAECRYAEYRRVVITSLSLLGIYSTTGIIKPWITSLPYFIEYSSHFFTLKMILNYSLHTIHGR
jgi:hypothetical protein